MKNNPKAWGVPVWTKRLGADGQEPMLVQYAAAYGDVNDAVEAVKTFIGFSVDGDKIGTAMPLLDSTVNELGLAPGQVRMI